MNNMDANRTSPAYELKDELARLCLPAANRDANLKLAWVNSVCILFLLIGIVGARRGLIAIKPAPPLEEIVPVVVEPMTLPPQETMKQKQADEDKIDAPRVAVVIPQSPNISFSVPTIGSLVVPANLATAPPLEPMQTAAAISCRQQHRRGRRTAGTALSTNRAGRSAARHDSLLLGGDAAGNVISVEVKESSGFPFLDRATVEFIKQHWHLPVGTGNQLFQTSITYKLQLN